MWNNTQRSISIIKHRVKYVYKQVMYVAAYYITPFVGEKTAIAYRNKYIGRQPENILLHLRSCIT